MKLRNGTPTQTPRAFSGLVGIARRDVTPPVGIYNRLWGASKHDVAEGIHRPMTTTALAFRHRSGDSSPLVLISLDLSHLADGPEVSEEIACILGLDQSALMVACSHTHSSPWLGHDRESLPGGNLLPAYRKTLIQEMTAAARDAIAAAQPATITWATGRCALAAQRDFTDPRSPDRVVCGFNPEVVADDTVLFGRITRDKDDAIIGTIVNYACHPTTLAWDNRLISPDYIGAMREVIEAATGGAPCAFTQGAAGELAPALQYVGDTAIADRHGRALGHAVLSALSLMLPPRHELYYEGAVESGTALGVWRTRPFEPSTEMSAREFGVPLPLKEAISNAPAPLGRDERIVDERSRRRTLLRHRVGGESHAPWPVWAWRLGDSIFLGLEGETYSVFQVQLRHAFPDAAIVAMNLVNGGLGYIYPAELQGQDQIYQVWQSPFGAQAMPVLIRACETACREMLTGADERQRKQLVSAEQK